ncbi:alcohol dehydrogenase catalytic domain-containing protein [Plantibacter sp. Mn2098]|uniref:alcohol dehydrogenase catalytic domain-containing protein n=1 Tax=Plantibacter sp. Mn2098 TaxID=3395266 RepID=UPI003BCEB39A
MPTYSAIQVAPDGSLEATERELVEPAPGHVRIRVEACGVCHSDSLAVHEHAASEIGRVPGHEAVGRIDAVGDGVGSWSIGDRVGVGYLGGHCGVCDRCRRGDFTGCTDQPATGVTVDGGYAEVLYARQSGLVAIPDELSSIEAAPLLCAGFTTFNALRKAAAAPGDLVAVQGIGGLGHLGLQYARKMGARVVAIARGTDKAPLAKGLGAQDYIDSRSVDPGKALQALGGADVVLATAASGASMTALVPGIARGGRLMVVGASFEPIEVSPISLIFGDVTVGGSLTGSSIENEDNLRFAAENGVRAMIEEAPLADAAAAYARMMDGDARFRMVLAIA